MCGRVHNDGSLVQFRKDLPRSRVGHGVASVKLGAKAPVRAGGKEDLLAVEGHPVNGDAISRKQEYQAVFLHLFIRQPPKGQMALAHILAYAQERREL